VPGVVLHVGGDEFDPFPILGGLSLDPYAVFRRGDLCFPNSTSDRRYDVGGFKCLVSEADGILADEVQDAIAFLTRYKADLATVRRLPAVESIYLDFGHFSRMDDAKVVVQCDNLPAELLRLAGDLGIDIELSMYPRRNPGPT
jgi:hypothetical protein